jgi:BCD family chlorophyll transporter-like MFS transporter
VRRSRSWPALGRASLAAGLAFLLVGAGLQTAQTAGLALATDLATERDPAARGGADVRDAAAGHGGQRPAPSACCWPTSRPLRLVQVVQGAAVVTLVLNLVALWKQEAARPLALPRGAAGRARLPAGLGAASLPHGRISRFLLAVGLGTAAFNMQDIILEPYGGEVLGLSVGQTCAADRR